MEIGWIEVLMKVYGETIYADMVQSALSKHHQFEMIKVGLDRFKKYLYPTLLYRLCRISGDKDLWVRNFDSVITMPYDGTRGKNVALIFHIDYSFQPTYLKLSWRMLERIFYHHLKRADAIVTISKYWQNHFGERGYPKVYMIYNAFDMDQFQFEDQEISDFRHRFRLEGNPVIYLGNCQLIKGVVDAYNHLKGLDVHFVTSGRKEVNLPALNLNLNYRDYLLLLRSSSVVIAMSKFKEGWNRTAHEAMLCKTPVIGSGLGGMKELLEGGDQIICPEFADLREKVSFALDHPEVGERGYQFAKQFTVEKFNDEWLSLVETLNEEE
jgi:glycosyltransferase involved in cell wall biosynthesis